MPSGRKRILWRVTPLVGLVVALGFLAIAGKMPPALEAVLPLVGLIVLMAVVFAAVYHADVIAHRTGEPYGTLVLTVAVTVIEVALILSIMLAGEGLQATSQGKRVKFEGQKRTVTDGPFAETKELIAGFWLWQVRSMDEAVEWLKRAPFDGGTEIEVRRVFEAEDFGSNATAEVMERDANLRRQIAVKKQNL